MTRRGLGGSRLSRGQIPLFVPRFGNALVVTNTETPLIYLPEDPLLGVSVTTLSKAEGHVVSPVGPGVTFSEPGNTWKAVHTGARPETHN